MARKRVLKATEAANEAIKITEDLAKGAPSVPKDMEAGKAE